MSRKIIYTPRTKNLKSEVKALIGDYYPGGKESVKILVRNIINLSVQNMAHWYGIKLGKEDFIIYNALGVGVGEKE